MGGAGARERMLVIVNPHATTVSAGVERLVIRALEGRYVVDAVRTHARDHATELARGAAREGFDLVVAFGGDGTVSEVANGLVGSGTPLALLPGGATNVFARLLGVPRDVIDAAELLLDKAGRLEPRRIDTGRAGGRHFLFAAGIGLDASMVARVERRPRLKARLRQHYFAYAALRSYFAEYLRDPPRLRVEVGGRAIEGVTVIAQNADPLSYFGVRPVRVAPRAGLETGALSISVLERARLVDLMTLLPRLFGGGAEGHRDVTTIEARNPVRVAALDGPFQLELDGEHLGELGDVELAVEPRSLAILR